MSRIYFHSQHGVAEVLGSERAYLGGLANDMALAVLDPHLDRRERLLPLVPSGHYLHATGGDDRQWWERGFRTWFRVGWDGAGLVVDGTAHDPFGIALNTLVAMGNEVLRFCARVHGYCEIHGWVDDSERNWLAGVIDRGREENILREGVGWESVTAFLRETSGPVVMSYSVCEGFPNSGVADWIAPTCAACDGNGRPNPRMKYTDVDYDYCTTCGGEGSMSDDWYDLPTDEQWALGMRGIRARKYDLRLMPNDGRGFGGPSAFDIANRPAPVATS
jgi:hypothetical protein